jgi:hypothetical protein
MGDDFLNKHPLQDLIDNNEPEAVEYWLYDEDIAALDHDRAAGRITAETFQAKADAWLSGWRKKLDALHRDFSREAPLSTPQDAGAAAISAHSPTEPRRGANPETTVPAELQPQKVRGRGRGPSR